MDYSVQSYAAPTEPEDSYLHAGAARVRRPTYKGRYVTALRREPARNFTIIPGDDKRAAAEPTKAIAAQFRTLVRKWESDTMLMSNPNDMHMHPAYMRIIGMGPAVLPLVFKELEAGGGHWFGALKALTGKDPVPKKRWGDVAAMRMAWLEWWHKQSSR